MDIATDNTFSLFLVKDYIQIYNFILQDLAKLTTQKKAIMQSMKTTTIDYSIFHNVELKRNLTR